MVEAKLCLFEVEVEGMSWNSAEPCKTSFRQAPEAFDSVDVIALPSELVLAVFDPEVLVKAQVDEPVVTCPAIGVEHRAEACSATNHSLQRGFGGVRHDRRVDLVAALEEAEDDGLAACAASALAAHALWPEVGFVGLKHTFQRRLALALGSDFSAHAQIDRVHRTYGKTNDASRLSRRQIEREAPHQVPKLLLT